MPEVQSVNKPFLLWLLPPLAAGAVFRLLNLPHQVLGGDELHAVRAILLRPLSEIFFTYQRSDHCLPLSAFYRLLMDSGVPMTEMAFRLPVLASGLIMLLAAPMLAVRVVGRRAALVFSWLLALSPVMIYYSRIARSYAPLVLLVFCALFSFYSWWDGRGWRHGLLFVFLSALALYFHLGAGPIIASPYVYAAGTMLADRRWRGGGRPGVAHLCAVGLLQMMAVAAFLVPSWTSLQTLVGTKRLEQRFSFEALGEALRLQSGSAWLLLTLLFWFATAAGLVLLLRRAPRFGLFTLAAISIHLAGLVVLSPLGLNVPRILNRYLIPALPFILLYVAIALSRPWPGGRGVRWKPAATAALLLLLVLGGPLVNAELLTSSFVHHNDFISFVSPRANLAADDVPDFYHLLARGELEGGPLLEYPWSTVWHQGQALYIYQRVHGQEVLVGPVDNLYDASPLRFRNMPKINGGAILASRARYLVIHIDWVREENRVESRRWIKKDLALQLARCARQLGEHVGRSWGRPVYLDRQIMVWDLEPVRARMSARNRDANSEGKP